MPELTASPPQPGVFREDSVRRAREEVVPRPGLVAAVRPAEKMDLRETAMESLGRIGAPSVSGLLRSLTHPDPSRRVQAAKVLARIGPDARLAVPDLIAALGDPNLEVRISAARALGQIGPAAEAAVGPLLEIVEQAN